MTASTVRSEIAMPELSEGMQEGVLIEWLVADGAPVSAGDPIAEIETDKASTSFEADADGVLSHRVPVGATVPVGDVVAVISPEHEPATAERPQPSSSPGAQLPPKPTGSITSGNPATAVPTSAVVEDGPAAQAKDPQSTFASPLARRIARQRGVDLAQVSGTGPRGRVLRIDVEQAADALAPASASPTQKPASPRAPSTTDTRQRVTPSRLQHAIARRMLQATSTIPDFSLSTVVEMDDAVQMRSQLSGHAKRVGDKAPSYNDMVIKACGMALREHPMANGSYQDETFVLNDRINVGMAVAANDALIVPTIFDADTASLTTISAEARRLAGKVRDTTITSAEIADGTFTVSNLGMFGISRFVAVINPPQAAILAVGELAQVPVVRDDALAIGHRMELTLSCDHRILYGATAAAFLARVREILQTPWTLLL